MRNPIALLAAAAVLACTESDPTSVAPTVAPMSATIDGKPWSAAWFTRTRVVDDVVIVDGADGGTIETSTSILLIFPKSLGHHVFVPPSQGGQVMTAYTPWSTLNGGNGSVTVDTLTEHRITGSFEFTAGTTLEIPVKTRRITAGRFALNYCTTRCLAPDVH